MSNPKSAVLRWSTLLLACVVLAACAPSDPPDTHPGQPVTKRKQLFKQIVRTFEPMGLALRGHDELDKQTFLANAVELQRLAKLPWSYFTPDSNYPPTRARAEVWSRNAEFQEAGRQFELVTSQLVEAAQSGDIARINSAYDNVHKSCQACHREFRGTVHGEN